MAQSSASWPVVAPLLVFLAAIFLVSSFRHRHGGTPKAGSQPKIRHVTCGRIPRRAKSPSARFLSPLPSFTLSGSSPVIEVKQIAEEEFALLARRGSWSVDTDGAPLTPFQETSRFAGIQHRNVESPAPSRPRLSCRFALSAYP